VVAHFHYVMMGSTLIAFFGALHYWWPKFTGRMYPERIGQWIAVIIFVSFNVTFLPQFLLGSRGMPRRYWDYPDAAFQPLHQLSTVGALIMGLAIFVMICYLVWSLFYGKKAPANPWGGSTLEWATSSPPPEFNFDEAPELPPLYDYDDIVYDEKTGGWIRDSDKHAEHHEPDESKADDRDEAEAKSQADQDDDADDKEEGQ
jgi:cytochrome c oxidase subunit 1